MFITLDHRLDCTKAKVQWTARGETLPIYAVEEPEFLTPRSCFNELLHAVETHEEVKKAAGNLRSIVNVDDAT